MNVYFSILALLLVVPSVALADATNDCKASSEAVAPAQNAWVECERNKGVNQCADEASQLFEVGITALEKCGPLDPEAICSNLGDPRKICTSDVQCQRAEVAWNKHCADFKLRREGQNDQGASSDTYSTP